MHDTLDIGQRDRRLGVFSHIQHLHFQVGGLDAAAEHAQVDGQALVKALARPLDHGGGRRFGDRADFEFLETVTDDVCASVYHEHGVAREHIVDRFFRIRIFLTLGGEQAVFYGGVSRIARKLRERVDEQPPGFRLVRQGVDEDQAGVPFPTDLDFIEKNILRG